MRANRAGRNESLSRVSDEIAVFQVSPHAYLWIVATGPCLRACLPASAVKIYERVVYEEKMEDEAQDALCSEVGGMLAVSCHTRHRAEVPSEAPITSIAYLECEIS